jgi:protein TonB
MPKRDLAQIMLRDADRFEGESDAVDFTPATAAKAASAAPEVSPATPGRYGERQSVNLPSVAIIVLIHAVLIGAALQARHHYVRHREARMVVVNLMPPPPPPAEDIPPPPAAQPEIVAPPPLVQTPVPPRPQVATTPEPPPVSSALAVTAPPAPPSPVPSRPAATGPVQGGDLAAQMVAGKAPRYPVESLRKREQGTVILSLIVGVDGRVSSISIARSSGFPRLDNAARDAVRSWRWSPIIRNGQAVMVQGFVDFPFVLQG